MVFYATSLARANSACQVPAVPVAQKPVKIDWVKNDAKTDAYLFVLSWSPEFCFQQGKNPKNKYQCQINRFDFVVHGLWPQSNHAKDKYGHPRFCKRAQMVNHDLVKRYFCIMPGADLIQEQWAKHGVCAFGSPDDYFHKIDELWRTLHIPDLRGLSPSGNKTLTAGDVTRAFTASNKAAGLQEDNLLVRVGKGNYLREVIICYDKAFYFKSCEARGTPHNQRIRVTF